MILKDVKGHFHNGFDSIISARYDGKEERHFFYKKHGNQLGQLLYKYEQMTPKQENLYRKHNSL